MRKNGLKRLWVLCNRLDIVFRKCDRSYHTVGIPVPDLRIQYTTFTGIRWWLRVVYIWTSPWSSVFGRKFSKSKHSAKLANVWGPISREGGHAPARNFTHLKYFRERVHKQHKGKIDLQIFVPTPLIYSPLGAPVSGLGADISIISSPLARWEHQLKFDLMQNFRPSTLKGSAATGKIWSIFRQDSGHVRGLAPRPLCTNRLLRSAVTFGHKLPTKSRMPRVLGGSRFSGTNF